MPSIELDREERLDEILADYLRAVESGKPPSRKQLLDSNPDLAEDLAAFFADQDRFHRMATPLRGIAPATQVLNRLGDFGDYEIIDEIARGGMGAVYKARQRSLRRLVALKVLLSGQFAGNAELMRFRAEAEAVAALNHPNIVPLFDFGSQDGRPYLSMKLVTGGSLADITRKGPMKGPDAARLMVAVADAIHFAHQHGILHRDLKPANILLDDQGQPHVTDFGLAKRDRSRLPDDAAATVSLALTDTGAVVGTPSYMAPEQARGRKSDVTTSVDVYGLGAILYEMLTGRAPFKGESALDTMRQVVECEPSRPSILRAGVNRDLETICLKCLAKNPAERYLSAAHLANDLRRYLGNQPIHARPISLPERLRRWAVRQPVVAGLSAALLLTALIGFGVIFGLWRTAEAHAQEIERQEKELEAQAELVKQKKTEAENNAKAAEESRKDAVAGLDMAHQVVNEFVVDYSVMIERAPGLQPQSKKKLESALSYYNKFLTIRGNDATLKAEIAETHLRIGDITQRIGRKADALVAYRKAQDLFRELDRGKPNDPAVQVKLASLPNSIAPLRERSEDVVADCEESRVLFVRFLGDRPDDPALRSGLARTLTTLSAGLHSQGQADLALCRCQEADALQKQDLERRPDDDLLLRDRTVTLNTLSLLLGQKPASRRKALEVQEEVVRIQDRRLGKHPGDALRKSELANAVYDLAVALEHLGDVKARQRFEEVLNRREELTKENPRVNRFWAEKCVSLTHLGLTQLAERTPGDALKSFGTTRDILQQLTTADPAAPSYRMDLARTYYYIAETNQTLKRSPDALQALEKAAPLQRELLKEDAKNIELHSDLARTLAAEAALLADQAKVKEALELVVEALPLQRVAFEKATQRFDQRRTLDDLYELQAHLLRKQGDAAAAVEATRQRQRLWTHDADGLYAAARDYARAAAVAAKGKPERATEYLNLALQTLTAAVDDGYRGYAIMSDDADLKPLRERAEFRTLLQRVQEASRKPRPTPAGAGADASTFGEKASRDWLDRRRSVWPRGGNEPKGRNEN
jgi:serine/threonine protein kinase